MVFFSLWLKTFCTDVTPSMSFGLHYQKTVIMFYSKITLIITNNTLQKNHFIIFNSIFQGQINVKILHKGIMLTPILWSPVLDAVWHKNEATTFAIVTLGIQHVSMHKGALYNFQVTFKLLKINWTSSVKCLHFSNERLTDGTRTERQAGRHCDRDGERQNRSTKPKNPSLLSHGYGILNEDRRHIHISQLYYGND